MKGVAVLKTLTSEQYAFALPDRLTALRRLAEVYEHLGLTGEAMTVCERFLRDAPADDERRPQVEEHLQLLQPIIVPPPHVPPESATPTAADADLPEFTLTRALMRLIFTLGDPTECARELATALRDPTNTRLLARMNDQRKMTAIRMCIVDGAAAEALPFVEDLARDDHRALLRRQPHEVDALRDPSRLILLAETYATAGQIGRAIELYEQLLPVVDEVSRAAVAHALTVLRGKKP